MPIIAPIPRSERRLMRKTIHKTRDKNHARRLNAILMLHDGNSVSHIARTLCCARSSIGRWINWLSASCLYGTKMVTGSRARLAQSSAYFTYTRPTQEKKMAAIHEALQKCSVDNPVFYEDEVDIHLNPKIGADWQVRGQQKRVVTPGQNEKYYLAGALHSGTGKVSYVGGSSKSSALFISLLEHLKATYSRAKTITLIVDNYIIHKSQQTLKWLKQNPKFRVIYQPVYSPWVNHVERLWQALHDTITRNHQCRVMWQLLKKVRHFMETVSPFPGGKHGKAKV